MSVPTKARVFLDEKKNSRGFFGALCSVPSELLGITQSKYKKIALRRLYYQLKYRQIDI